MEITVLLRFYLVSPATNAVSEKTASMMRRFRNGLRSRMRQDWLNRTSLLSIRKEDTDKLDLVDIANMFCERNDERQRVFGVFWKQDLKLP